MTIQSVDRAIDILSLFSASQVSLGVTEIGGALKLPKGTVWSLVVTLEKRGLLQQDPDTRKYCLGPKLYEFGMLFGAGLEINNKAAVPAQRLASLTQFQARVGIYDRGMVLIMLHAVPRAKDSLASQIGPRVPAYCSGLGKAMLAFLKPEELQAYLDQTELVRLAPRTITDPEMLLKDLEETRLRGYSITRQEMIAGDGALGAPIFNRKGELAGSISLSGKPKIILGKRMEEIAEELVSTASKISEQMGYYLGIHNVRHHKEGGGDKP